MGEGVCGQVAGALEEADEDVFAGDLKELVRMGMDELEGMGSYVDE